MSIDLFLPHNPPEWFKVFHQMNIDRLSMLALIQAIHVSLETGRCRKGTEKVMRSVGAGMAKILLDNGLVIGSEVKQSWTRIFGLRLPRH